MTLTPKQFNILATKDDLKLIKEEIIEEIGEKLNLILNSVDGIAKKHQDFEVELTANQGAHDRFEETFAKTNQRIKAIEVRIDTGHVAA